MASSTKAPPRRRQRRVLRLAIAVLALTLGLDQLLRWTFLARPAGAIGAMIELSGNAEPPYFKLRPGLQTTYKSWGQGNITQIHTNELGFRDPERAAERAQGTRRILVTGDSITFGIGVDDEGAFPRQMEQELHASGATNIEVWNAGVPGYAMADHLGMLRQRLLPLHPDLVILQLSRNDDASPMPLDETFLASLRYSGFARAWMIYRFNFVPDLALFRSSFNAYIDECERARVPLLLAYEGLPDGAEAEIFDIARERGVPILPISGPSYPHLPDDPHFNLEGNHQVALTLNAEVSKMLSLEHPPGQ